MALALADSNVYPVSGGSSQSVTIDGTGSNRLIVVIVSARNANVATCDTFTLNGVQGTTFDNSSVDGGYASMVAVGYFLNSQNPGSGSFTLDTSWSSFTPVHFIYEVLEFTGADQTTPLGQYAASTNTNVSNGDTLGVTLSNASGKYGVTFLASADLNSAAGGNHTITGEATEIDETSKNTNRMSTATDAVVSSNSVTYTWTVRHNGTDNADSVIAGTFCVHDVSAATAPTISGVSGNNAEGTVTITVDSYDTVAGAQYGGVDLTDVTEATATTITATMPRDGFAFGSSNNFTVTDVNGTSNEFAADFEAPSGWSYVTLSVTFANLNADSPWFGEANYSGMAIGDQIAFDATSNSGGYTVTVSTDGVMTLAAASGEASDETVDFYCVDASQNYQAQSVNRTVTLLIGSTVGARLLNGSKLKRMRLVG